MAASHILRADAALFERPPFVTGASPRQSLPFSPDDPAHFEPDFFDRGGSPTPSECSFDFEEWTASNSAAADSVADLLNALHSPGAGLGRVLQLYEAEQAEAEQAARIAQAERDAHAMAKLEAKLNARAESLVARLELRRGWGAWYARRAERSRARDLLAEIFDLRRSGHFGECGWTLRAAWIDFVSLCAASARAAYLDNLGWLDAYELRRNRAWLTWLQACVDATWRRRAAACSTSTWHSAAVAGAWRTWLEEACATLRLRRLLQQLPVRRAWRAWHSCVRLRKLARGVGMRMLRADLTRSWSTWHAHAEASRRAKGGRADGAQRAVLIGELRQWIQLARARSAYLIWLDGWSSAIASTALLTRALATLGNQSTAAAFRTWRAGTVPRAKKGGLARRALASPLRSFSFGRSSRKPAANATTSKPSKPAASPAKPPKAAPASPRDKKAAAATPATPTRRLFSPLRRPSSGNSGGKRADASADAHAVTLADAPAEGSVRDLVVAAEARAAASLAAVEAARRRAESSPPGPARRRDAAFRQEV